MSGTRRSTSAGPGADCVDDATIARWRLRTQHLVEPFCPTADGVVGTLLAVQAENHVQATWAVAARTRECDPTDLTRLLDTGQVLRTHVLRPTWHYVRADDIGWLLDLTGPRVRKVTGRQLETVHGLDPAAGDPPGHRLRPLARRPEGDRRLSSALLRRGRRLE